MTIKQVLDRLAAEVPRTDYAAGVRAYADSMLRNGHDVGAEVPTSYTPLQEMLLGGSADWEAKGHEFKMMGDDEAIAKRLGLDKVIDVKNTDMGKVQGAAMKSAFMLIWAEVECMNRMGETFMIRRTMR